MLILLFAALATASPQNADATKSPADIFGRVVNSETRGPVRRAALKVFNASGQWDTITDGEGRFRFYGLVPGDYNLVVHRDGYTDRAYIVEKSDFTKQEELPVELRPQGLVTGRAVDGSGEVLQSAVIEAMAQKARGGMFEVVTSVRTNDLGEYRLSGLDPGVYQVRATYRGGRSSELDPTPVTNRIVRLKPVSARYPVNEIHQIITVPVEIGFSFMGRGIGDRVMDPKTWTKNGPLLR
jgi:hypothetical protein